VIAGEIVYLLKLRNELSKQLGDAAKDLRKVGGDFQEVGRMATVGFTLPIVGAGAAALKMATDFNAAMANVASLIPGNTARVLELKDAVQAMAIETGKSTGDLADGMYQVISAFGDSSDSVKILDINARAATAGLATTTDAINLTSAVTKGYGDTSAAAVRQVSDLALMTVRLGQTTFPELAASIGRVTPLAAELGVKQSELFGVMATFTGVTGNAAEVSTQFRGVLQALLAPTSSMSDLLASLGVESGRALIQQRGLQGAIQAIVDVAKSSGGQLKDYIGSIEGQTLALSAAGAQSQTLTEKMAAMLRAAGATEAAFKEQTDGVNKAGHSWKQLVQQFVVAGQRLGDSLLPILMNAGAAIAPMVDIVLGLVSAFGSLPDSVQTFIVALVAVKAAVGPVLVGVGGVLNVMSTLATSAVFTSTAVGIRSVGLSAAAAGPQILAFAAAAAGVIALGQLVRNAVGLYNDRLEQNRTAAEHAKIHQLALAEASRVAGRAITDVGEAQEILRQHSAALRAEQERQAAAQAAAVQQTRAHAPEIRTLAAALAATKEELAALTPYQRENIAAGLKLGMSVEDVAKAVKASEAAVGLYKERLAELEGQTKKADEAQRKFLASVRSAPAGWLPYAAAIADAGGELQNIGAGLEGNGALLSGSIEDMAAAQEAARKWAFENRATLAPSLRDTRDDIDDARRAAQTWGKTLTDVIARVPGLVQSALTGGGGLSGALQGVVSAFGEAGLGKLFAADGALGKALGGGLTKLFGTTVGGALATAIPGIGAAIGSLIGPLIGKIGSLFTDKNAAEVRRYNGEIEKVRESLIRQHGSLEALEAKARAVGLSFRENWGHQGRAGLEAFNALVDEFTRKWDDLNARFQSAQQEVDTLIGRGRSLGYEFDQAGNLVSVSVDRMREVAQRFGVDLQALGPAFDQQQLRAQMNEVIEGFTLMDLGGAQTGVILTGLKDEINAIVNDSIKLGVDIPENMRPWIAELIRTGQLTDENGEKITDISQIKFGDPIKTQWEEISSALKAAADTLAQIAATLAAIPTNREVTVTTRHVSTYESQGEPTGREEGYAVGTIGMTGSWFRDFGAGRQVTLHGREAVVREDQAADFARAHGAGDAGALARIEKLLRDQPRQMALAVQNAVALGGRA
jgi:TP901 family phage tail tape measure protein